MIPLLKAGFMEQIFLCFSQQIHSCTKINWQGRRKIHKTNKFPTYFYQECHSPNRSISINFVGKRPQNFREKRLDIDRFWWWRMTTVFIEGVKDFPLHALDVHFDVVNFQIEWMLRLKIRKFYVRKECLIYKIWYLI